MEGRSTLNRTAGQPLAKLRPPSASTGSACFFRAQEWTHEIEIFEGSEVKLQIELQSDVAEHCTSA